jgi:two-component system, NtrC family, sensor histidine kinase HydH
MAQRTSSALSRWARWGLLAVTLAMGVALIGTAWASRRRVNEASELLVVGQTQSFFRTLFAQLRQDPEITSAELESWLADNEQFGVRYLEVRAQDAPRVHAGTPEAPVPEKIANWDGPPYQISRIGTRVRVIARMPPRRPPHRTGAPPPPPAAPSPHPHGLLVMEFEPLIGNRLQEDAGRAFALNCAVAGAFVLVAAALWRLLRQREQAEARAEQEHRLAMLGEMSAVLAHEIRNPLASLKGNAQLLSEQLENGAPSRRKADRVVREAERIEALTSSLLDFVRSGSVELEQVNPAELIAKSAASINAEFDVDSRAAPEHFRLDPLRMQQVFTNLLENAVQNHRGDTLVRVRVRWRERGLEVTVRDRGPGIPSGQEERVFQPFHTTRTQGVGLGLAVARRIVELHGGTLTATNHPEGGAVFTVSIPGSV